jgi:MFS family permease
VLAAFLGALILTQVFWYNFAPLISLLTAKYRISGLTASWTILVFPLASMLFSGYAGAVIDRRGYRFAIQCGLALMAVSAGLRVFDGFSMLLAGQIGIAISVPLIVTSISTLVADWFGPAEEALFTGICTIGIFVGMALSLAASPLLVEWLGFRGAMSLLAAVAAGWALCRTGEPPGARGGFGGEAGRYTGAGVADEPQPGRHLRDRLYRAGMLQCPDHLAGGDLARTRLFERCRGNGGGNDYRRRHCRCAVDSPVAG